MPGNIEKSNWDKELAAELRKQAFGTYHFTQEQIGCVIGIVAEHRLIADREGYKRGYNTGYADCYRKLSLES